MNPILKCLSKPEPRIDWPSFAFRLFVAGLALYGAGVLVPGIVRMIVKRVGG